MTTAEATELILTYCDKVYKRVNKFYLLKGKIEISIEITKILETWQKDANLALPETLSFPENLMIDFEGIHTDNKLIKWDEVELTVISTHVLPSREYEPAIYEYYFIGCLNNGEIIDRPLGDINKYANLLGHFIELYKANRTS